MTVSGRAGWRKGTTPKLPDKRAARRGRGKVKPFSRGTSSRNSAIARFCSAFSLSSFKTSCRSSAFDRPEISGTAITDRLNRTAPGRGKQNINSRPVFCPVTCSIAKALICL
jgi:hypothetical protein